MATTNVVQLSAASRKRDRDHINREQREGHVIHESSTRTPSFGDGDGLPPIVVQVILNTQDYVVEETKDQEVNRRIRRSFGEWVLMICTFWLGFSLFS